MTAVDSKARVLNSVKDANVDGIPGDRGQGYRRQSQERSVKETLTILGALPESMRSPLPRSPLRRRIR